MMALVQNELLLGGSRTSGVAPLSVVPSSPVVFAQHSPTPLTRFKKWLQNVELGGLFPAFEREGYLTRKKLALLGKKGAADLKILLNVNGSDASELEEAFRSLGLLLSCARTDGRLIGRAVFKTNVIRCYVHSDE